MCIRDSPQANLFDRKGNLKFTLIGKQDETTIRNSINQLVSEEESQQAILNGQFSVIKENKNNEVTPRSHGWFYQSKDFDTIGKLCLKIDLQFWAIDLCSSWVPCADLRWM